MNEITNLQISVLPVKFDSRPRSPITMPLFEKTNDEPAETRAAMMIENAYSGTRKLSVVNLYMFTKISAPTRATPGVTESEFRSKNADSNMARVLSNFAMRLAAGSCHSTSNDSPIAVPSAFLYPNTPIHSPSPDIPYLGNSTTQPRLRTASTRNNQLNMRSCSWNVTRTASATPNRVVPTSPIVFRNTRSGIVAHKVDSTARASSDTSDQLRRKTKRVSRYHGSKTKAAPK